MSDQDLTTKVQGSYLMFEDAEIKCELTLISIRDDLYNLKHDEF